MKLIYDDMILHNKDVGIFYVGRTNNPARRRGEHLRDPRFEHRLQFELYVVQTDLGWMQARALEQVLIAGFTLQKLDNIRNSIAIGNYGSLWNYLDAARTLVRLP